MKKYNWDVEKLREVVKNCVNFGEVLDILQVPRVGNNTKTLREILERENIDYTHFTGRAREYSKPGVKDINYYLTNQGYIKTSSLKEKLLKEGLKENKCECCGITEWNGKPIVMQLHHIDGNNKNNSLNNLQMLCPNCHSQTENYCGSANITKETNKKFYCLDCGKEINKDSKYCPVCVHNHKTENSGRCPSLEQFVKDFIELKGFSQVGNKYGVTDNSVKKWAIKFNLPYHTKELLEYINNHTLEEILSNENNKNFIRNNGQFKTKFDHNLILKLIDLRYTTKEISEYIGCSVNTVKAIGSKYKHPIRKANTKCIHCLDENNNVVKYCFGGVNAAHWLFKEKNYTTYSLRTLEDMVTSSIKKCLRIDGIFFKAKELPSIKLIINDDEKIEELRNLLYIE